jgi:NADH-quinone oxidoreductase subunit J
MNIAILILALFSVILAVRMLLAKSPVTSALCLLGILLMTAGIYGLIGEHMVATIQLVVYAGAIMVLFVFSIMLLNLTDEDLDFKKNPFLFYAGIGTGALIFFLLVIGIYDHFINFWPLETMGNFSQSTIRSLGGNAKVLSHALFSQYYISFEVISLALLVAIVGAVVLAKRKLD